jgi:hypothetical protein
MQTISGKTRFDSDTRGSKLEVMKVATAPSNGDRAEMANLSTVIKAAMRELASIRKANKTADAEIRRLRTSTRKRLTRIQENLRHVEATR